MASISVRAEPGRRQRLRLWASGFRERETWAAFAFLSPWLFGFFIFTGGPMVASAVLSFTDYSVIQETRGVGLENYRELINDPRVGTALRNTFIYTALMVPADMILSLALAMMLTRIGRLAGFFRTVFYLPVMTPAVAVGILYLLLFNGDFGLVNEALGVIGINGPYWTTDPNWVKPGLVLMQLWSVGASVVILFAALMTVPPHLYEAAEIDGASRWRRFRDVTLPMISPALFFLVIINTINGLQTFDQVYTAFFNQNTPYGSEASLFYVVYLFQEAFAFFRMGYASALAWLLFAVIALVTIVQFVVSRRFVYYEGTSR